MSSPQHRIAPSSTLAFGIGQAFVEQLFAAWRLIVTRPLRRSTPFRALVTRISSSSLTLSARDSRSRLHREHHHEGDKGRMMRPPPTRRHQTTDQRREHKIAAAANAFWSPQRVGDRSIRDWLAPVPPGRGGQRSYR
jgi:hypothetical protein